MSLVSRRPRGLSVQDIRDGGETSTAGKRVSYPSSQPADAPAFSMVARVFWYPSFCSLNSALATAWTATQ